jgi:hypothetical protein
VGRVVASGAARDRRRLVYTDCCLMATRVYGTRELIAAPDADDRTEIVHCVRQTNAAPDMRDIRSAVSAHTVRADPS